MIFDDPDGPAADLRGTISEVLTDLAEAAWLPGGTPGETARAAVTLDRLAAELAEAAAMTRALPGRPAQAASHTRAATAALRTAARAEADVAGWLAGRDPYHHRAGAGHLPDHQPAAGLGRLAVTAARHRPAACYRGARRAAALTTASPPARQFTPPGIPPCALFPLPTSRRQRR
jgi:hypothetical protein